MFSLICVWINGWVNSRKAGDLRHYRGHYDVSVMQGFCIIFGDKIRSFEIASEICLNLAALRYWIERLQKRHVDHARWRWWIINRLVIYRLGLSCYNLKRGKFLVNTLSVAFLSRWTGSSLAQIMACSLCGATPFPFPIVTSDLGLNPKEQTSARLQENIIESNQFSLTKVYMNFIFLLWWSFLWREMS